MDEDHLSGKVILFGENRKNYEMESEFKFLGHHLSIEEAGWFGFVIRAMNTENYELVWFMPHAEQDSTVAYLPVAHGVVPWWTEAYRLQEKGRVFIPKETWFRAKVVVQDNEVLVFVEDEEIFQKKLTYYLTEGRSGLYVGTATDVAFKRIKIIDL